MKIEGERGNKLTVGTQWYTRFAPQLDGQAKAQALPVSPRDITRRAVRMPGINSPGIQNATATATEYRFEDER